MTKLWSACQIILNAPMARQAILAATPTAGKTINNFITRLQKLAAHCEYELGREGQSGARSRHFIHKGPKPQIKTVS